MQVYFLVIALSSALTRLFCTCSNVQVFVLSVALLLSALTRLMLGPGVQVYVLYIGLLLSALNRLPLKLPQNNAGRRHQQKSQSAARITFEDVAGVDEAKEELAEIVVGWLID